MIEDSQPDVLPIGWVHATLGQVLTDVQPGFASGEHSSDGVGLPHLRPMNVTRGGHIDRSDLRSVAPEKAARPTRRLRNGDVLFNNTNSLELVGKTALFEDSDAPAFSNHMTRLRPNAAVAEPAFIARWLHARWRAGDFQTLANNHVSQASISRGVLVGLPIALPPLREQRRIVALLDDVETRRGTVATRLAAARAALERFREAVFVAACSGRLTADWREREPSWSRDALSEAPGPLDPGDDEQTSVSSPPEWTRTNLGALLAFVTSGSRGWAKYYATEGPLFVRAQNISSDRLEVADAAHVRPPEGAEGARTRVARGDLLITITGANVTRAAVVDRDIGEAYVNQHVALARPATPDIAEFLHLWLISAAHGRMRLLEDAYGAGKPGLNLTNIRSVPVALPTLEEQSEIVRRATRMVDVADRLSMQIDRTAETLARATNAAVAQAFRGDLVPPEEELSGKSLSGDLESVESLLARIAPIDDGNPRRGRNVSN